MRTARVFTSLGVTVAVIAACSKSPDERCEQTVTYDLKGAVLYDPVIIGDCQPYLGPQVGAVSDNGLSDQSTGNGGAPGNGNGPPDNGNGTPDNGNGAPDNGNDSQAPGGTVRSGEPATGGGNMSIGSNGETTSMPSFSVGAGG